MNKELQRITPQRAGEIALKIIYLFYKKQEFNFPSCAFVFWCRGISKKIKMEDTALFYEFAKNNIYDVVVEKNHEDTNKPDEVNQSEFKEIYGIIALKLLVFECDTQEKANKLLEDHEILKVAEQHELDSLMSHFLFNQD